jgi:hypothetical protein
MFYYYNRIQTIFSENEQFPYLIRIVHGISFRKTLSCYYSRYPRRLSEIKFCMYAK